MGKTINLKVGRKTDVISLKTSIAGNIKSCETIYIDTIGMGSNYVAIKAIIMARGQLNSMGYALVANPYFKEYEINDPIDSSIKTGICWVLKGTKNF